MLSLVSVKASISQCHSPNISDNIKGPNFYLNISINIDFSFCYMFIFDFVYTSLYPYSFSLSFHSLYLLLIAQKEMEKEAIIPFRYSLRKTETMACIFTESP
jgi:hypothetical protein